MLFGRNRNVKPETVVLPESLRHLQSSAGETEQSDRSGGPYDITERPDKKGYLNLGSLRLPSKKDFSVRLDVEEKSKRVVGVTVTDQKSTLQIQAFAAPRSGGLWDEIRAEIQESVQKNQGANVTTQEGRFGTEVMARIPAKMPNGKTGWRVARFMGVDGPRWFIRGVLGGQASFDEAAAKPLLNIFADAVVDRGDAALPPRELLPLKPPENMKPVRVQRRGARKGGRSAKRVQNSQEGRRATPEPQRGPEITEIR